MTLTHSQMLGMALASPPCLAPHSTEQAAVLLLARCDTVIGTATRSTSYPHRYYKYGIRKYIVIIDTSVQECTACLVTVCCTVQGEA